MKQEILEMHKKLQAFYKKMMGEWIPKDGVYQGSFREGFIVRTHSKRGVIIADVYYKSVDTVMVYDVRTLNDLAIRLPLPIDPVNPSRGLWGMVDWSKLRYEQWGPDGELAIFKLPYIQYNEDMGIPIKDHPFVVAEPETALLMALLEQEGL
jgi:hypothetical protein